MSSPTSVLIVDDEPAVRDLMSRWVSSLGLEPRTAASADEALETLRAGRCDLAVIDVVMPGRDGLWLATELRRDHPQTAVVIATAYTELLDSQADQAPIADFLIKPFQRERFALAVDRGRQWRKNALADVEWHARLGREVQERTAQIAGAVRAAIDGGASDMATLRAVAGERLAETTAHAERVARYSLTVARHLGLTPEDCRTNEAAALFHDIGKAAMPDALLTKPSPLTPGERAIMRRHVESGGAILDAAAALHAAAGAVRASHEWFGGGGYPRQLAGAAIPLASRIISVADAYDAMTQDRAYRIRLDSRDAIAELMRCCPAQFDPDVVAAFLAVLGRH
jgi:putative nucleotidyltransferase with HDIG domain